ncbi:MAG: glycosyltransferase family 4 protein [Acidimicrobiales bacterium]
MSRLHFVFVLEQGIGHTVHSMNIESALEAEPDLDATVIRLGPVATSGVRPLPLVNNWSAQMSWAARRALRGALSQSPIDCALIHTQVAALFSRKVMRAIPTVVSLDATPLNFDSVGGAYGHHRQPGGIEAMKRHLTRRSLADSAAIVTWSQWAANSVVQDYRVPPEKVHAIYPGVQLSRFAPRRERHADPVRLLFVGGDFDRKGGPDLLDAVSSLGFPVKLDIVTSTPLPNTLSAAGNVRVHRNVQPNSREMVDLYGRADIFVLPTRGDCTPLVIAEAMASGLPVVATAIGSIPDMLRDGVNGLLVQPGRPDMLCAALRRLVAQPALRRRMESAARKLAEAEHDTLVNCRRIFDLMRYAANTPRSAAAQQVVA